MAQIKTKLKGTIELETITNKDGNEFIPHTALSSYIYDEMFGEVSVDTTVVPASSGVLATCKMTDVKTGRSVVGIGESIPSENESEYEKSHRAFSAANRAFDNAAFLFLGIDRSTLARSEAASNEPAPKVDIPPKADTSKEEPAAKTAKETTPEIDPDNPFDSVIAGGKYKGKTYREVAAEDPGYAQWTVEKSKASQEIKDIFAALLQS